MPFGAVRTSMILTWISPKLNSVHVRDSDTWMLHSGLKLNPDKSELLVSCCT